MIEGDNGEIERFDASKANKMIAGAVADGMLSLDRTDFVADPDERQYS
jgi:hypothetical protein